MHGSAIIIYQYSSGNQCPVICFTDSNESYPQSHESSSACSSGCLPPSVLVVLFRICYVSTQESIEGWNIIHFAPLMKCFLYAPHFFFYCRQGELITWLMASNTQKYPLWLKLEWVWKMENVPRKLNKSSSSRVGVRGCANSCFSSSSASTEEWAEAERRGVGDNCAVSASYLAKEEDDTHHVASFCSLRIAKPGPRGMRWPTKIRWYGRTNLWLYCPC